MVDLLKSINEREKKLEGKIREMRLLLLALALATILLFLWVTVLKDYLGIQSFIKSPPLTEFSLTNKLGHEVFKIFTSKHHPSIVLRDVRGVNRLRIGARIFSSFLNFKRSSSLLISKIRSQQVRMAFLDL